MKTIRLILHYILWRVVYVEKSVTSEVSNGVYETYDDSAYEQKIRILGWVLLLPVFIIPILIIFLSEIFMGLARFFKINPPYCRIKMKRGFKKRY